MVERKKEVEERNDTNLAHWANCSNHWSSIDYRFNRSIRDNHISCNRCVYAKYGEIKEKWEKYAQKEKESC